MFHANIATKLHIFFRDHTNLFDLLGGFYFTIPSAQWFYNHPANNAMLLTMMSFAALFIAPLNSISNTIKDGNLLQVSYVKERFNYTIVSRYIIVLVAAIFVRNFVFSAGCLIFMVFDILIFYKRYTNFIFHNRSVLVNFLAQKIRNENKTSKIFLTTFNEMKAVLNRFEQKYRSHDQAYNTSLTVKSRVRAQELEKGKFRNFLYLTNRILNYTKQDAKKKNRNFRSRLFFNLKDFQFYFSIDFTNNKEPTEQTVEQLRQKLEKWFIDCFEYLPDDKKGFILPYLIEDLDIHFFDLYQKNEFKILFSNIDLVKEAIARADLKIGYGAYDVLYFFSKIFLQYPEMNKVVSFSDKLYHLWLVVFEKIVELDNSIVEFAFKNLAFAVKQEFVSEFYIRHNLTKDLHAVLQKKSKVIGDDFLFYFFYSLVQVVLYLQKKNIPAYTAFLEMINFFNKELSSAEGKIYCKDGAEKNATVYAKESLLLLTSYYFHQNKKKLAKLIFGYLDQDVAAIFFSLIRNDNKVRRWSWAEWFRSEYFEGISLERISLRDCTLNFVLSSLIKQKSYQNLTALNYQEEDVECLQKMIQLLENKNDKLKSVLLDCLYKAIRKEKNPLEEKRITEFYHCCDLGYELAMKLSDLWKFQLQDKRGTKIGYDLLMKKQVFLQKEPLKLEDFESYGEDLAKIENTTLKEQLMRRFSVSDLSYQKIFQKILPEAIQQPEVEVIFFGNSYEITKFFIGEEQINSFEKHLTLSIDRKKKNIFSDMYALGATQNIYAFHYKQQKKNFYFLPDNNKQNVHLLLFSKLDKLQLRYSKIEAGNNYTANYSSYRLTLPSTDPKFIQTFLKNKKINTEQEGDVLLSTRINFEAYVAPEIIFSQKKYLSCLYYIKN